MTDSEDLRAAIINRDDCWLYARDCNNHGYGRVSYAVNKVRMSELVHRAMYENFVGEIPDGLMLDHLCETPICVNPSHLEPVTNQENMIRHYRNKTHCRNGHEYTDDNIYWIKKKTGAIHRSCKRCYCDTSKRTYYRKQAVNNQQSKGE